MNEEIEEFLKEHELCFDRFTFDNIFRFLLKNDFEHEEARNTILYNCSLSVLVSQERVHNRYYYKIKAEDEVSNDLSTLRNELERNYLEKIITDLINK